VRKKWQTLGTCSWPALTHGEAEDDLQARFGWPNFETEESISKMTAMASTEEAVWLARLATPSAWTRKIYNPNTPSLAVTRGRNFHNSAQEA
jgi:hypothetical protein